MPDVPGSGPTDPEASPEMVIRAIHSGAEPYRGHFRFLRSKEERWLGVVLDEHNLPVWVLTLTRGVGIDDATHEKLAGARVQNRLVIVGENRYALRAPKPSAIVQFATLVPVK